MVNKLAPFDGDQLEVKAGYTLSQFIQRKRLNKTFNLPLLIPFFEPYVFFGLLVTKERKEVSSKLVQSPFNERNLCKLSILIKI